MQLEFVHSISDQRKGRGNRKDSTQPEGLHGGYRTVELREAAQKFACLAL